MATVRPAAVAGTFYPSDPNELRGSIESLLRAEPPPEIDIRPAMLVVPHASYVYSGPIAAGCWIVRSEHPGGYPCAVRQ